MRRNDSVTICIVLSVGMGSGVGCHKSGEATFAAAETETGQLRIDRTESHNAVADPTALAGRPGATVGPSDVSVNASNPEADADSVSSASSLSPATPDETGSNGSSKRDGTESKNAESSTGESGIGEPADEPPLSDMKVRPRIKAREGGLLDLTFDDVEFDIEKDAPFDRSMLTPEIESMDGQEVIIRGFILESYQLRNIKEFVLVRDNQECCFGPGAYIYHNMQVEMVGDARAEYSIRPVTIRGTFTIKPWIGPDDKCYSVFHIAATSFKK